MGKSEELVWGCWHGSVPGRPGELWTAGGWGWSLVDDAGCRGAGVCRPTHGPGGRAAGVEGGVSVKPQGCLALRGEQTDWGVGELKSLGLHLLRGSGLAHLPSISLQSWQIPPGTSHLGDMTPCVQNSGRARVKPRGARAGHGMVMSLDACWGCLCGRQHEWSLAALSQSGITERTESVGRQKPGWGRTWKSPSVRRGWTAVSGLFSCPAWLRACIQ